MTIKTMCSYCKSKDNLVMFDNGSSKCMTPNCQYNLTKPKQSTSQDFLLDEIFKPLDDRCLTEETCRIMGISKQIYNNSPCTVFNYYDVNKKLISQHIRFEPKQFIWLKYNKSICLFGQHLYEPDLNKDIVITEGEYDAATIHQLTNINIFSVVSIPTGSESCKSSLEQSKDWLLGFRSIILCFDNDKAGQEATDAALSVLPIYKVRICKFPLKDANDMLKAGRGQEVVECLEKCDYLRPKGLIFGNELKPEDFYNPEPQGLDLPYPKLNELLRGVKKGRLYMIGAGTGVGKSSIAREFAYYWMCKYPNLKIANLFLEETQKDTLHSYIGMHLGIPMHRIAENPHIIKEDLFNKTFNEINGKGNLAFTDAAFELNSVSLFNMLDYLAISKRYDMIILDHISIIISGSKATMNGERRDIDELMHKLRALIKKSGCTVLAISHLTDPERNRKFEDGGIVKPSDFRGSKSISHLSDVMIGLERNTMSETDQTKMRIRVIKNRITSRLGLTDEVFYIGNTGRIVTLGELFDDN